MARGVGHALRLQSGRKEQPGGVLRLRRGLERHVHRHTVYAHAQRLRHRGGGGAERRRVGRRFWPVHEGPQRLHPESQLPQGLWEQREVRHRGERRQDIPRHRRHVLHGVGLRHAADQRPDVQRHHGPVLRQASERHRLVERRWSRQDGVEALPTRRCCEVWLGAEPGGDADAAGSPVHLVGLHVQGILAGVGQDMQPGMLQF
mmetsp:Transcript_22108/g.58945  ORF Transcript_22108/g.58945 Transcript_22108/m.58945 type:complete len:203 (+) Transcript_22108:728-1336(+)